MDGIPGLPDRPPFGHLQQVRNIDPRFGSAPRYTRVLVYDPETEQFRTLLLTESDLRRQARRELMNPEESIEPNMADRIKARV